MVGLLATGAVRAQVTDSPDSLIWCGLDYSRAKLIGTTDFMRPAEIFPGMLVAWNGLFMKEMLPELEKMTSSVGTDMAAVGAANDKASSKQIEREDGTREEKVNLSHLKEKDIAGAVSLQRRLLENAARLLKPGGRLVYSTCSLEPEENKLDPAIWRVQKEELTLPTERHSGGYQVLATRKT